MEEVERKESTDEREMAGDDALDEEMATAMSALHGRSAQRVPSQVTFGHGKYEVQYGGG